MTVSGLVGSLVCQHVLSTHEQIVPSPPKTQRGFTATGKWSEHSLAAMGERTFLVVEFDFAPLTPMGKPTIWAPLLDRCQAAGITVACLDDRLFGKQVSPGMDPLPGGARGKPA
jgi:hypothetical protein